MLTGLSAFAKAVKCEENLWGLAKAPLEGLGHYAELMETADTTAPKASRSGTDLARADRRGARCLFTVNPH